MDMRFGAKNKNSLYRPYSLMTFSKEPSKCNLYLVGVQEVRWEGSGTEPAGECIFFYEKGKDNHGLGTSSFVHKRSISTVRGLRFLVIESQRLLL
jgi:hypothetical protein